MAENLPSPAKADIIPSTFLCGGISVLTLNTPCPTGTRALKAISKALNPGERKSPIHN